jgi:acyl-CoA synthetase (AMP-forming)/AMP-acid ligase II
MAHLLVDQLRLMAERFGSEVAYVNLDAGTSLTFAEWDNRSNRLARGLVRSGVGPGDRVCVHLPPEDALDWMVAYASVHKAGAVAVPTNTRLVGRELCDLLSHAGATVLLCSPATAAVAASVQSDVPSLRFIAVAPWSELPDADESTFQVPVDDHDLADIMYTSGTTGRPKGVVVRHDNAAMIPNGLPKWTGGGWLHSSPLSTFAGIASVYNPMKLGLRGLFLPKFDAGRWLSLVESERPVAAFLVPAMAQLLIAHPDFETADLSSIAMCSLGSAPLAPETQRRLQARLPNAVAANSYGMTEAGPAYCSMPADEVRRRVGSVGKPVPPVEFRVVAPDGGSPSEPLPAGEIGELIIRNPGREREYYRDPEATAAAWHEGWLRSGDLAYLDTDGYLYIVGRAKDVIIRGGNNVHATDVEAVLFEHPAVMAAAVAGIPHEVLGEDVAAWIVVNAGQAVTAEELRAHCLQRLANYKAPRTFIFVDTLPRNATGKVVKADLRL